MHFQNIYKYWLINNIIVYNIVLPIVTSLIISRCLHTIPSQLVLGLVSIVLDGSTLYGISDVSTCNTTENCISVANKLLQKDKVSVIGFQSFGTNISKLTIFDIIFIVYNLLSFILLISVICVKCFTKFNAMILIINIVQTSLSKVFLIIAIIMKWNDLLKETRIVLFLFGMFALIPLLYTLIVQYIVSLNYKESDNDDSYETLYIED